MAVETAEGMSSPPNQAIDRPVVLSGRWLTFLWPLAILFHLAGNGGHLLALQAGLNLVGVVQLAIVAAAAVMLVRPGERVAATLAVLFVLVTWIKMPVVGNHEIILGLFSLSVLPAVIAGGSRWPQLVAPAGRLILLIAYGFIAFSKLNAGFLDTVGSCAVLFADEFGGLVGFQPGRSGAVSGLVIAATVVIEACIPVLLFIGRFRRFGVGLALGFHFVLALDPVAHIWDFSATLLPLFLLFASSEFHDAIDRRFLAIDRRQPSERALVVLLVLAMQAVAMGRGLIGLPTWAVAFPLWLLVSGAVTVAYWSSLRHRPSPSDPSDPRRGPVMVLSGGPRLMNVAMLLIVGVAALNGIAPYLELRSAAAFNMYSNLRIVDGASNHLLIGGIRSGDEATYATLVDVDDGSVLEFYVVRELAVPVENLDRFLIEHPDEDPLVLDSGRSTSARSLGYGVIDADIDWFDNIYSAVVRKLGARRAVHTERETATGEGPESGSGTGCLRAWGPIG